MYFTYFLNSAFQLARLKNYNNTVVTLEKCLTVDEKQKEISKFY